MMLIIAALLMELAKTKSVLNLMNNVDLSKKKWIITKCDYFLIYTNVCRVYRVYIYRA